MIQTESHDANRKNGKKNVRVDEAVVLLPEKPSNTRCTSEHLARDDDQPGDTEAQSIASKKEGQSRRNHDLRERREWREPQHLRHVPIVLWNRFDAGHPTDHPPHSR